MKRLSPHPRAWAAFALAVAASGACDERDPLAPLSPVVTADVAVVDFDELDKSFGPGAEKTVRVTNTGTATIALGAAELEGDAASDYAVTSGGQATELAPAATLELRVVFSPTETGERHAAVVIPTGHAGTGSVVVALSGRGRAFSYRQVDRVGIPSLNTVFNHPPQFSKTDYNIASPKDDLAVYTGLFETVLGAVGNSDPSGTAALLLPDELPVDMGAVTTALATLTGRDLPDDAVDVALSVVVGAPALHSDNVDANDVAFLARFPYLAPPHGE